MVRPKITLLLVVTIASGLASAVLSRTLVSGTHARRFLEDYSAGVPFQTTKLVLHEDEVATVAMTSDLRAPEAARPVGVLGRLLVRSTASLPRSEAVAPLPRIWVVCHSRAVGPFLLVTDLDAAGERERTVDVIHERSLDVAVGKWSRSSEFVVNRSYLPRSPSHQARLTQLQRTSTPSLVSLASRFQRRVEAAELKAVGPPDRMVALRDTWKFRFGTVSLLLGLIWFVWTLDALIPGPGSAAGIGIVPRTWTGLQGIPTAPFIHVGLDHVISNSIPLAILGSLIVISGAMDLVFVVLIAALVGGFGTWLFGSGDAQHVGASGLVFGFFGYLVFRVAFDRRLISAVITLTIAALYGGAMAVSLIPHDGISWSGHFFGFLGGIAAARIRLPPPSRVRGHTKRLLSEVELLPPPPD